LAGAVAYLAVQLKQTEKLNEEALSKLQSSYEEKLNTVNSRINVLDREVVGLKNRPIVEHAAGISENLLNQKLAALRAELLNRDGATPSSAENTEESTTLAPTPQAISPTPTTLSENQKIANELLLASGAIIVRNMAEDGVGFAYEAEVLQILAQGNELAERNVQIVRNYANTGVIGKQKLIRNFDKIFAELNTAELKAETAKSEPAAEDKIKWYNKVLNWLKQQVTAKKRIKKPEFTPKEDEVLELVNDGRIKDALDALKMSEKYAKIHSEPLAQWVYQAERYLEFDNAINAIIMNALANIRLKEMEH
jgi:HD-GYP domain-containing protein (c-di-GMP phosphodiesterase class II)